MSSGGPGAIISPPASPPRRRGAILSQAVAAASAGAAAAAGAAAGRAKNAIVRGATAFKEGAVLTGRAIEKRAAAIGERTKLLGNAGLERVKTRAEALGTAVSAAKKKIDDERDAAPAAVVAAVAAAVGNAKIADPSADTTPTADSLHISTLLNYLPIIVLVVILLIGFVSWDLMKSNWPIIVTLLLTFLYVVYMNYLTPSKFFKLKEIDQTFLPSPPTEYDTNEENYKQKFIRYFVPFFLIILGLGFGFGSIAASDPKNVSNYNLTQSMIGFGSMFLIGGVIYFVNQKFFSGKSLSEYIHYVVLSFIIGIPLIVRGNEINKNIDELKDNPLSNDESKKNFAENSADVLLGFGLFFQIAFFMAAGYFVWRYSKTEGDGGFKFTQRWVIIGIFIAVIGILASIFMAASQKDPGIAGAKDLTEYGQKVFLVHGIIWFIVLVGLLTTLFGQTKQFKVHSVLKYAMPVFVIFVGYVTFPIVFQTTKIKEPTAEDILKMDAKGDGTFAESGYYQQLRAEVIKDLQKKDPNANLNADSTELNNAIQSRLDQDRKKSYTPTTALLWIFSIISVIIVAIMAMAFKSRIDLGDKDAGTPYVNINADVKTKIIEDKMLSDDWDKILSSNEDANFFAILKIRLAKWFSLVPFLSVILIIMWVSVLFTNVTTSPQTSDWIASKFSGDMFPRVKELVDAFFIVIIAGLSLCAILLLPAVKEMNAGGLESILKFAESVQVWQFKNVGELSLKNWGLAIVGFLLVFGGGLSWWWHYLRITKPAEEEKTGVSLPNIPENWGWAIGFVVLLAICVMPTFFSISGDEPRINEDFAKENVLKLILRQILTTVYLVPLLFAVVFRAGVYGIASLTGLQEFINKRNEALDTLKFWKWDAEKTDLRMFPTTEDARPRPATVTSVRSAPAAASAKSAATAAVSAPPSPTPDPESNGINETKVGAIGKLIKVILLTISFVILILAVIYYVYKIDAEFVNKSGEADAKASGGFAAQMNSPTAHTIYVIMAIVAVAGLVAYIRDKFTKANSKTPENYLFDDLKTEDATNPLRQLAFGATHIFYVILMVIVWIYDREIDDKNQMSITGMTVLGLAILFFHYGLEFIDTMNPEKSAGGEKPSVTDLFTNIRFIINTVFFIVLCALAYYKQHGVMVVLILAMFIFHLTKSAIGIKLLHLLWLGIIYIPCLFLDFLQSSQSAVGDTTRPIWIIVAIELLLIAILYGGPYLLNYIGASASQIVAAPVTLKEKYDTNLNTQSPKIFIFHNTGIDRSPEDKAANCPVEEKKRYNYSISGWFILNNNVTSTTRDLELFNFGDVPSLKYNPSTTELKLYCNTLDMSGNPKNDRELIYSSRTNYNSIISGKTVDKQRRLRMLLDNDDELDTTIPLQRWNYFVVNYNGKTMDFFLNTKLIVRSDFIMPDIQLKPITVGDEKGLNGSVCNFAFHTTPLTKEQMRWTYNMLKSQNPPIIGMKTIEDDVKTAGSTTVYSK
jgi:Ca2+/Na+ antiporter